VNHEFYIRRTLELAQRGGLDVSPNPMVGCCIVHQNRIIGEGWHEEYGFEHAEVNAIESVQPQDRHLIAQSTLYVSLEPCCYHGLTPPCTDLILRHLIPRVVICNLDPNPRFAGEGVKRLRAQGVEVHTGVLAQEGAWFNRRFFTYHKKKRPYIILKFAQSADGFMSKKGEQTWISGKVAKRLTHKWRSEEDAILIGTNTAEIDNPQLTNRLFGTGEAQPMRLVFDRTTRLSGKLNIFKDGATTWIFYDPKISTYYEDFMKHLESKHDFVFEAYAIDFSQNVLQQVLDICYEFKTKSIIVEGGAQLLQSFISENLWDEARIFTASHHLNEGIVAPKLSGNIVQQINLENDKLTVLTRQLKQPVL